MRNRFRHSEQRRRTGAIIISAVANRIGSAGRANADVIVMRAHRDEFTFQNGIAAFPNGHDVLR